MMGLAPQQESKASSGYAVMFVSMSGIGARHSDLAYAEFRA